MSQLLNNKRRKTQNADDSESEDEPEALAQAGYIKRLTLKNFMCHEHFELLFGPKLNFIIGRNGSGKSAILTGISVGLGAKAIDTSRGSSIKSLIKDGKSTARITIELSNEGVGSFQREVFGKTIYIERKITKDGANSYQIRGENKAVVGTRKRLVDDILQRFFIAVNNPLSFLSQDKAREFIASSTEQSRFAHFSEGTNLLQILQNYQDASRKILNLQNRSQGANEFLEEAKQKYLESERAYKRYKHTHTLRKQLEKIHGKIYWFNCEVLQRRIAKKSKDIELLTEGMKQADEEVTALREKLDTSAGQLDSLQQKVTTLEKTQAKAQKDVEKAEEESNAAHERMASYRSDLSNYKKEIEGYVEEIKRHEENIEKEQKKIDLSLGGTKEEMAERLTMLQQHLERFADSREKLQESLRLWENGPRLEAVNASLSEVRAQRLDLEASKRQLERLKSDQFAAFGSSIHALLQSIKSEQRWHNQPIGPIGSLVRLKEGFNEFGDVINTLLSKTLDSFLVFDEHDRRLLSEHMKRIRIHKSVLVRKPEEFNFEPVSSPECASMLEALEFENDTLKFLLIDTNHIESALLCPSLQMAEMVTKSSTVSVAVSLNDHRSAVRISRQRGALSRDPVFYHKDLRKLSGSVTHANFDVKLQELSSEESRLTHERNRLLLENKKAKDEVAMKLEEKKAQIKDIQKQIYTLQTNIEDDGDHGRIDSLRAQIESCESQIKSREGMSVELLRTLSKSKDELAVARDNFQAVRRKKEEVDEKLIAVKDQIEEIKQAAETLEAEIERLQKKRESMEQEKFDTEESINDDKVKLEELTVEAQEKCDRSEIEILETDTTDSITHEFQSLQKQIEEVELLSSKSFEEIQNELLKNKERKDQCESNVTEMNNARVTLENDLNFRFENLSMTIKDKITRAQLAFELSLALRGFKGTLDFDFARKRVITEIQTKDDRGNRAVQSLSGGEKSFTQIAFLLSIWKVMRPRVCGLDEFDVFMDSVNRTIAIRLLIHELRHFNSQSIFITPQDIAVVGGLEDSEDVNIHRISPPRND